VKTDTLRKNLLSRDNLNFKPSGFIGFVLI
jgi:hypothetical protein